MTSRLRTRLSRFSRPAALAVVGTVLAATLAGAAALHAQDDTEELEAEKARVAKEALDKAIARGKELWSDKSQLGVKKTCTQCHDNPDKPFLDLATRDWSYPAYSRRKRAVVTLQQKINEMLKYQARGKVLDADSTDLAALAAYCMSLKADK